METLITGLIVTAISGITFLAYKHQNGYRKIHQFIGPIATTGFMLASIWNYAVSTTAIELNQFIAADQSLNALNSKRELEFPLMWVFIATASLYLYSLFLLYLQQILDINDHKEE